MTIYKYEMSIVQPHHQERSASAVQDLGQLILANSPYLIIVTQADGRIVFVNRAAEAIFRQSSKTICGRPISNLLQPVQGNVVSPGNSGCLQSKETLTEDYHANLSDGAQIAVEMTIVSIKCDGSDGDEAELLLYMGRDVTEERNLQRQASQRERLTARGEMAAEIAHELNNYLSVVCGNLELLTMALERANPENARARIKPMKDGLQRITKFVEGLMSIPSPSFKKEITDINGFLKGELAFIKSQAPFDRIKFTCRWGADIPPVELDCAQLRQALFDILNNAAEALSAVPQAGREVMISTAYSASNKSIELTISDNGRGMGDEDLGRVFRQHFTTKNSGHGFGLLAVKRAVKAHGGRVAASRRPEGGTSFTIELPCPTPISANTATVVPG